jgi:DNA-binding LacI/PurR family transcriptional regulator
LSFAVSGDDVQVDEEVHVRAATIIDVARRAGVSTSTASRVLTGSSRVSSTAYRNVTRAAAELDYVPNPAARSLVARGGTRVVIGVVSPQPTLTVDAYLGRVIAAAAQSCAAQRIGVALQPLPLHGMGPLAELARDSTVHGVVLVNTTDAALQAVDRQLSGRVVSIGVGSRLVPSVDVDNDAGADAIVRHLVGSGRRRIVMVTGPRWLPCARRSVRAYSRVMHEGGLEPHLVAGDFTAARGRAAASTILARWPDVDAIFAICDATAAGVLAELRTRAIRVPGDVAVAGFDDSPLAELSQLTTATHPVELIAEEAIKAVLKAGPVRPQDKLFPSRLVLRDSA